MHRDRRPDAGAFHALPHRQSHNSVAQSGSEIEIRWQAGNEQKSLDDNSAEERNLRKQPALH